MYGPIANDTGVDSAPSRGTAHGMCLRVPTAHRVTGNFWHGFASLGRQCICPLYSF